MANQNFSYTGAVQQWIVPAGVTSVLIECWGAQGQNDDDALGGRGGYAKGNLTVSPGEVLNIYVGGQGNGANGGWNGGGSEDYYGYAGGGASDVRQAGTGLTDRKIVAGGGGGAGWYGEDREYNACNGGAGGGISGINGSTAGSAVPGEGATQTTGYAFGQGSYFPPAYLTSGPQWAAGAGGGGYYGGKSGMMSYGDCPGGGGGSGYIGGLTDGELIAGNTSIPAPGGGSETGHSGNGYVRITWTAALVYPVYCYTT